MLSILRSRVSGGFLLDAIDGARLSYGSGANADSALDGATLTIGPNDTALCRRLVTGGGTGEDKLLRAMPVSSFVRAPLRWWVQMDTYRLAPPDGPLTEVASTAVRQSESLMHRTARRGPFTAADFTATTDARLIAIVNEKYDAWLASGARRNSTSPEWEALQDAIGRGYLYTAQWYANYAVIRNVYRQRRHHRQGEWRAWCAWAETLPHAALLITLEKPS